MVISFYMICYIRLSTDAANGFCITLPSIIQSGAKRRTNYYADYNNIVYLKVRRMIVKSYVPYLNNFITKRKMRDYQFQRC